MASQKYTNLGTATLTSAYTSGDTTLHLGSGQGASFPSGGDFIVALDSPPAFYLKCTARSTDNLTVTSTAVETTTLANKASGVGVTEVITAGALNALRGDMMAYGTASGLPTTSEAHQGDQYQCSDAPIRFTYDGSAWQPQGPVYPLTLPVLSSFTALGTTATTSDTTVGITLSGTNSGASTYYRTAPGSTPFTITMGFMGVIGLEDFGTVSLIGRSSSSSKVIQFGVQHNGVNQMKIFVNKLNSDLTFSAQYVSRDFLFGGGVLFLRVKDDGTNRLSQVSIDGQTFGQLHSIGRTDFATCDQYGWNIGGSTNFPACGRIIHWTQA